MISCDVTQIEPFVRLALGCVQRPYPYHLVHVVNSDADVRAPRELNPAFYGCYDWHSAVHGHWTLVRGIHLFPDASWSGEVRAVLARRLTESNLKTEADYLAAPGREGFERPYGLAWLLQLSAELRELASASTGVPMGEAAMSPSPGTPGEGRGEGSASNARDSHLLKNPHPSLRPSEWERGEENALPLTGEGRWNGGACVLWLAPLEAIAVERLASWLPKLSHPIRSGEHSQTAFAMGLAIDWARRVNDEAFERLLVGRARDFYLNDRDAPLDYEPSGHDFLSPALAEADLMRRVLATDEFGSWLRAFLPDVKLSPVRSSDPADGKLSHLDGLNLSRAWMLEGIAHALPEDDPRRTALLATAKAHADAGLGAIQAVHYAGAHWLGSFAIYLLTRRGIGGV